MAKNKSKIEEGTVRITDKLPVLPLRELMIFPHMVMPLVVGRTGTLEAVEEAIGASRFIALILQKDPATEEPTPSEMYRVGVLGRIVQLMKLPNGLAKVLVEGVERVRVTRYYRKGHVLHANVKVLVDSSEETPAGEAARRHVAEILKEFVQLNRGIPDEIALTIDQIANPRRLADFVMIHLNRTIAQKQRYLDMDDTYQLLVKLAGELKKEIEILNLEQNIEGKVKDKISRSQRNYYLQEQLRAIKKELGEEGDDDLSDVMEYSQKVRKAKMPKEAEQRAEEEITRLENTPMMSPEATVIRNYLDWLISVPWYKVTKDNKDIPKARAILEEDHYGLEKPKERILEHLAVLTKAGKIRGPILCLVGPPGVGKTSLGKSIARTLNRKFVRISLGGVRDEAEIRGHRRTYIGSLPGRIIQSMKKAGTVNPLFLLDEVDKMSMDFRGDPSAALLEVLDPEQNHAFSDHYLEVDYDLSNVLFLTTANSRDGIPLPLQDRMEIIDLPGYLHQEKFEIAKRFLIPKQMVENGFSRNEITILDSALNDIIEKYTREAGVRELERCIAKIMRKSAIVTLTKKAETKPAGSIKRSGSRTRSTKHSREQTVRIDQRRAIEMLGVPKFDEPQIDGKDRVGSSVGLAWTPSGGDILIIEAEVLKGKGVLTITGKLGEVMQESARAALTAVRRRADRIGFDADSFLKQEIHLHVPEGAVSKDGPSAGITIAIAMASALSGRKVRGDTAMTGELTLRGEVLPIGGLREKLMSALRAGITKVIIPERNKKDLADVPLEIRQPIAIIPVRDIDQALDLMLLPSTTKSRRTNRRGRTTSVVVN